MSIFSELEGAAIREVARHLQPLSLPKGSTLFEKGGAGDALYVIQSGRIKIVGATDDGEEKILNYLGRGDTLGENALLTGSPRSVTAKVDSTANLLVLYKQDFDDFLKKDPVSSFYMSRLISQRVLAASGPPDSQCQLISFICDLSPDNHIVFMVNFALSLTEQTRRKTLLLQLGPLGAELVRSLGMDPILSSSRMWSAHDLENPKILEKVTAIHPSGLEILTLSADMFTGALFRGLPAFLDTLRKHYDYVLIDLQPLPDNPAHRGDGEIARAVLDESDSVYYAFSERAPSWRALRSLMEQTGEGEIDRVPKEGFKERPGGPAISPSHQKVKRIFLRPWDMGLAVPADFVVPWGPSISSGLKNLGHPYLTGPDVEATHRMLDRIARFTGNLQVGLAMGSGAAYGYTLIGMLRVFEREKIPIDYISGTSMGALLGSFYASGKSVDEIEQIAYSITKIWLRRNFLSDLNLPWPHGGILLGHTISRFLRGVLGEVEFRDMPISFACVATDIMTGDAVVMREGKVWEAVRASLSLPLIFRPYKRDNRFLVDGGLVNPVPTSLIASMGADVLISVNLTSKVSERKVSMRRLGIFPDKSPGFFSIFFKMIYTMQYQIASARTDISNIVIRPDTRNFSWIDFHKAKQIIPLGEEAAEEALTKIKSRLPFFADYCRVPLARRRANF